MAPSQKPTVLSARTHRALGWVTPGPEDALTALASVPVGAQEAQATASSLPLVVYYPPGRAPQLRALLGAAGVARWQSHELAHQPFGLRFYPFTALRGRPQGAADDDPLEWRLALHDSPDAVKPDGHPFFDPHGALSKGTQRIADLFKTACEDYDRALAQVGLLAQAGLLVALTPLRPDTLTIDSAALRDLNADDLTRLHAGEALKLAHAMETSRVHLRRLDLKPKAGAPATETSETDGSGFLDAVLSAMADDDPATVEPR